MAKILLTVSNKVSPFLTELLEAEKFTTSAESRFSANSNESRVRVEFSKKILAMVTSRKRRYFFDGPVYYFFKIVGCFKNQFNVFGGDVFDTE
jgi:hypothetical protein